MVVLVWRLTLYQKREVIALFICKLPKIKDFKEKMGSKFDTTIVCRGDRYMSTNILLINGSPKGKRSNTYKLATAFIDGIKEEKKALKND